LNISEAGQRGRCGDDLILQRSFHHVVIGISLEHIYANLIVPQVSDEPVATVEITPHTPISDERIGDDRACIALLHDNEYPQVDAWLRGYWSTRA
jgi:hypothetical protein